MTQTIKEIKEQLALVYTLEELEAYSAHQDSRKGVQKL